MTHAVPDSCMTLDALDARLKRWAIQHFRARELVQLDHPAWEGPRQPIPPRERIEHIRDTVRLADTIRARWGGPIVVTSGWRPLEYNRLVGSEDGSAHIPFRALDIRPAGRYSLIEYFQMVIDVIDDAHDAGMAVGLGLYYERHGRFAHIDVGHTDYNRDWARGGPEYDPDAPSNPFVEAYGD